MAVFCQLGNQSPDLGLSVGLASPHLHNNRGRFGLGECPGLVKGQSLKRPALGQTVGARDRNTLFQQLRKARSIGGRPRNREGTGARDHQDSNKPRKPLVQRLLEDNGPAD